MDRLYLERGQQVEIVTRWAPRSAYLEPAPDVVAWLRPPKPNAPKNVAIMRASGETVVRSFRGLRRIPNPSTGGTP